MRASPTARAAAPARKRCCRRRRWRLPATTCPRLAAGNEVPVVADFWADWCGPCKMMAPAFAQAARQRPRVQFVKVDTEASPKATAQYGIRGIPTMILFEGGGERARVSGAMAAAQLVGWIDGHLR